MNYLSFHEMKLMDLKQALAWALGKGLHVELIGRLYVAGEPEVLEDAEAEVGETLLACHRARQACLSM